MIYEDTHLVVLDKPAGLLSQGEKTGDENLVDWLRAYFGRNYVGLVHRLDRNTSGLMVVAKRTKSANRLTESLQKGDLFRAYLAWVAGRVEAPARWEHFLWKDENRNLVKAVTPAESARYPGAKRAVLSATPRARGEWRGLDLTLVEFVLETGRSHQIRAQSAAEGFPLLGDVKYLGPRAPRALAEFGRPALHSHWIRFPHPMSGDVMEWKIELPDDMAAVARVALE